jgi:hypothetical protein
MEYNIRDVVQVMKLRSGFYGVVVSKKLIEEGVNDGRYEYAVVPLDGGSVWHIHESCLRPPDRGFDAALIEKAMATYIHEEPMPSCISLDDASWVEALAKEGHATVGHIVFSFTLAIFSHKNCQINRDPATRMYWIRL